MKTLRLCSHLVGAGLFGLTACSDPGSNSTGPVSSPDGGPDATSPMEVGPCAPPSEPQHRENTGVWVDVEIPGAVCANGSPYRVFVKYAARSHNLVVTFEGGGACWDYPTCSGAAGHRGASHLDGIAADHMTALPPPLGTKQGAEPWAFLLPHLGQCDPHAPTAAYHQVFFPYCTGDVFAGNAAVTYENPADGSQLTLQHRGHENVRLALGWLAQQFPLVGRLLVTGFSAGGIGSLVNYTTLREALAPRCSYLLDDSGPLLSQNGYAGPMLRAVRASWQLDGLLAELEAKLGAGDGDGGVNGNLGNLLPSLARQYPEDRFLLTLFGRDLNFSLFAYQRFYADPPDDQVYAMWDADVAAQRADLEALPNAGYFMPAFRPDNCSHCLSIVPIDHLNDSSYVVGLLGGTADPYIGTEINPPGTRFNDALANLLGNDPLVEMVETPDDADRLSASASSACR